MRFEWDDRKDRVNRRKHEGISFELAKMAFDDERGLLSLDQVDEAGEQRWTLPGAVPVDAGIVLVVLVAHVYRESHDGEEVVRIISARRAGNNDVRRYREQEMD